jgi:hypothetical protein
LQQQEEVVVVAFFLEEMVKTLPREVLGLERELVQEVRMEPEDREPHRPLAMLMLAAVLVF